MRFFVVCLSALLVASSSFGAIPTLTVEGDDGQLALDLSAVSIRATIRGHLARTEYELTYRNSLDRVTGGEFNFPLPADAEVSDLGLWFDGHLRHGVAVERVLARKAYEETVHRAVDPALAEWSAGRGFRLSVYPIPAKGEKKVFIAYDQELTAGDYTLDVSYRDSVPKFDLNIDADGASIVEERGIVRVVRDARETAFVARSKEDGMWYASASLDFDVPAPEIAPASHVVILYDTSSSSVQQNQPLLRRFLSGFLARQQAWSTAEIVPFHVDIETPRMIENAGQPGALHALDRILGDLPPLGATNLIAVASRLQKLGTLPPSSRIVLVTDGLTSLGDSRNVAAAFAKLAGARPLLVVHATEDVDDDLLANAARATGGWAIDLTRVDSETAIEMSMHRPLAVRLEGSDVVPATLLASHRARFAIAARAKAALPTLPREVPVRELRDEREASMVRRAWARARLREMLASGADDAELIAHGRTFTQLTPRTSLLVLESWRDYARYDIPMPPDVVAEKKREEEERALAMQRRSQPPPLPSPVVPGQWSLTGRVLDDSGMTLPGVTVILRDGNVPLSSDITDHDGRFLVTSASAPKDPSLRAQLEGFNASTQKLPENPPTGMSTHIVLRVAAVTESITVTAAAPLVDVTATATATVIKPSLRSDGVIPTDRLLNAIAQETPTDDPEMKALAAQKRRELTQKVIERLRDIDSSAERLRYYLSARALLGGDKGFHVLAAEAFRDRSPEIAARVLCDLAEARPDDAPLLRILARVLDGWGEESLARLLLERAIEISPGEPQSWRELLLLEARHGHPAAVATLSKRMMAGKSENWMTEEVYEQTASALERWEKASLFERQRGNDIRIDENDDLTIELMFDTGWSYVDLHVTEPSGERVSYDHEQSVAGATFTGGSTFGFGPEIYRLPNAPRGKYMLAVDYYSDDETHVSLETLVHVVIHARGRGGRIGRREHFVVLARAEENRVLTTLEME